MFDDQFSHYLSYGATDQHTVRELRGNYHGLLVPGTVAAFQREGTGGFVLSLSASDAQTPYVIDPRSPLFQQNIPKPKRGHIALKAILGLPDSYSPVPSSFTDPLVKTVADNWAKFNCNYKTESIAKFDKYAKRLGDVKPSAASEPRLVLAPYFVAKSTSDPWWTVSTKLLAKTREAVARLAPDTTCIRVVATDDVAALSPLLASLTDEKKLAIWVSALEELKPTTDLATYGRAILGAAERGQELFALYGGFFAVLLSAAGLKGASHGIGYGEHRKYEELPTSGPPPARYYLPEVHRYVRPELADVLWGEQVSHCDCPVCASAPPILLDYHDLMMHSVHCRAREIESWTGMSLADAATRLATEAAEFLGRLGSSNLEDEPFKAEAVDSAAHIPDWVEALQKI